MAEIEARALPAQIMVWSAPPMGHCGTWSTTRFPPEAVAYADLSRLGPIYDLLPDAVAAAERAMQKYPQPNYIISKWAEETGEVTKDMIHMAEGRQTANNLRSEIVQALAMLHRLLIEGDQVHGLEPLAPAFQALKGGA